MAALPITKTDIVTPVALTLEINADILNAVNNHATIVDQGGHRWRYSFLIRPMNLFNDAATYNRLERFFRMNPVFEVPLYNPLPSTAAGTINVTNAATVGQSTVQTDSGGDLRPGQLIRFTNKSKVYEVDDDTAGLLTLTNPLRQNLSTAEDVVYGENDGLGNPIDGILGSFINESYGDPLGRVEKGILQTFRPLSLIENV